MYGSILMMGLRKLRLRKLLRCGEVGGKNRSR
jgi:hypothetical protein